MGWSLEQVHDLDADVYEELIAWIKDRNERRSGDGESIDMDQVIDAKKREDAASGSL